MRRLLIAGNWKMNKGPKETDVLLSGLKEEIDTIPETVDVLVCPPFVSLTNAQKQLDGYGVSLGAQNVHFEDNGAYTGEISLSMLAELDCEYVIVGHSERRQYFGETDKTVNARTKKILNGGLSPVICVGELLEQRKKDQHETVVRNQVRAALVGVESSDVPNTVIAYEPVWAIGTGETATPEQAQEMHKLIRSEIADLYDEGTAANVRVLYGGSMKPANAEDLLSQEDVDGGLIGGASLKADTFASIIRTAAKLS